MPLLFFILFFSSSLLAMDYQRKELPKEFLDKLPPEFQTCNKSSAPTPIGHSPLSLYRACNYQAFRHDAACVIPELKGQAKSCGFLAMMQRQLACWRLYRQSLKIAQYGLPLEDRRMPNHESEHSPYAWCKTPKEWYMQCTRNCVKQKKLCATLKQSSSDCSPLNSLWCYTQCYRELQRNKTLVK